MNAPRAAASSADVGMEATTLFAGLGILTLQLFPLALPCLLLVFGPLAVLAVAGLLLAIPFALPLWLARVVLRSRRRRTAGPPLGIGCGPATATEPQRT
jgi:hypothetical protein